MALPEVVSSGSRCWPWLSDWMLVTDAVATTLTKLGAPRHAETPRSGDIPERWPRRLPGTSQATTPLGSPR